MYGAILGDIIGSPYEGRTKMKSKDFPLFIEKSRFTDDSVMSLAICDGILEAGLGANELMMKTAMIVSMKIWGMRYRYAGYGGRFREWLTSIKCKPYYSYGNGSAMRVSSIGWLFDTLERTREVARWSAEITHNHPEGIKGAECVASVIWMARRYYKEEIKEYVVQNFGYDLSKTCDEIRPSYSFDVSCQGTVPQAITAFLEGTDFEDVIRTAVSLGGDCDTLTSIATSMAEAFYGVPKYLKEECLNRINEDMKEVLEKFEIGQLIQNWV